MPLSHNNQREAGASPAAIQSTTPDGSMRANRHSESVGTFTKDRNVYYIALFTYMSQVAALNFDVENADKNDCIDDELDREPASAMGLRRRRSQASPPASGSGLQSSYVARPSPTTQVLF